MSDATPQDLVDGSHDFYCGDGIVVDVDSDHDSRSSTLEAVNAEEDVDTPYDSNSYPDVCYDLSEKVHSPALDPNSNDKYHGPGSDHTNGPVTWEISDDEAEKEEIAKEKMIADFLKHVEGRGWEQKIKRKLEEMNIDIKNAKEQVRVKEIEANILKMGNDSSSAEACIECRNSSWHIYGPQCRNRRYERDESDQKRLEDAKGELKRLEAKRTMYKHASLQIMRDESIGAKQTPGTSEVTSTERDTAPKRSVVDIRNSNNTVLKRWEGGRSNYAEVQAHRKAVRDGVKGTILSELELRKLQPASGISTPSTTSSDDDIDMIDSPKDSSGELNASPSMLHTDSDDDDDLEDAGKGCMKSSYDPSSPPWVENNGEHVSPVSAVMRKAPEPAQLGDTHGLEQHRDVLMVLDRLGRERLRKALEETTKAITLQDHLQRAPWTEGSQERNCKETGSGSGFEEPLNFFQPDSPKLHKLAEESKQGMMNNRREMGCMDIPLPPFPAYKMGDNNLGSTKLAPVDWSKAPAATYVEVLSKDEYFPARSGDANAFRKGADPNQQRNTMGTNLNSIGAMTPDWNSPPLVISNTGNSRTTELHSSGRASSGYQHNTATLSGGFRNARPQIVSRQPRILEGINPSLETYSQWPTISLPNSQPRSNNDAESSVDVQNPVVPGTDGSQPNAPKLPLGTGVFSARAASDLTKNITDVHLPPHALNLPAFDTHADSPSIRKAPGVYHSISKPLLRDLQQASGFAQPAANTSRGNLPNASPTMVAPITDAPAIPQGHELDNPPSKPPSQQPKFFPCLPAGSGQFHFPASSIRRPWHHQPSNASGSTENSALQDYHMQMMLLEQQNKKRLMFARQAQEETHETAEEATAPETSSLGSFGEQHGLSDYEMQIMLIDQQNKKRLTAVRAEQGKLVEENELQLATDKNLQEKYQPQLKLTGQRDDRTYSQDTNSPSTGDVPMVPTSLIKDQANSAPAETFGSVAPQWSFSCNARVVNGKPQNSTIDCEQQKRQQLMDQHEQQEQNQQQRWQQLMNQQVQQEQERQQSNQHAQQAFLKAAFTEQQARFQKQKNAPPLQSTAGPPHQQISQQSPRSMEEWCASGSCPLGANHNHSGSASNTVKFNPRLATSGGTTSGRPKLPDTGAKPGFPARRVEGCGPQSGYVVVQESSEEDQRRRRHELREEQNIEPRSLTHKSPQGPARTNADAPAITTHASSSLAAFQHSVVVENLNLNITGTEVENMLSPIGGRENMQCKLLRLNPQNSTVTATLIFTSEEAIKKVIEHFNHALVNNLFVN
jgi:hypothetical protein